jgi:MoxR-like ATPase
MFVPILKNRTKSFFFQTILVSLAFASAHGATYIQTSLSPCANLMNARTQAQVFRAGREVVLSISENLRASAVYVDDMGASMARGLLAKTQILVTGDGGTGKTMAAKQALLTLTKEDLTYLLEANQNTPPSQIIGRIIEEKLKQGILELNRDGTLAEDGVLAVVIDEVQFLPPQTAQQLFSVLAGQYVTVNGRRVKLSVRTVLGTSNMTTEDFAAFYQRETNDPRGAIAYLDRWHEIFALTTFLPNDIQRALRVKLDRQRKTAAERDLRRRQQQRALQQAEQMQKEQNASVQTFHAGAAGGFIGSASGWVSSLLERLRTKQDSRPEDNHREPSATTSAIENFEEFEMIATQTIKVDAQLLDAVGLVWEEFAKKYSEIELAIANENKEILRRRDGSETIPKLAYFNPSSRTDAIIVKLIQMSAFLDYISLPDFEEKHLDAKTGLPKPLVLNVESLYRMRYRLLMGGPGRTLFDPVNLKMFWHSYVNFSGDHVSLTFKDIAENTHNMSIKMQKQADYLAEAGGIFESVVGNVVRQVRTANAASQIQINVGSVDPVIPPTDDHFADFGNKTFEQVVFENAVNALRSESEERRDLLSYESAPW